MQIPPRLLLVLALALAAVPARAACLGERLGTLAVTPRLDAARIAEGEQVLAAALTHRGLLEARATIKNGDFSEARFLLAGRPMVPVAKAALPAPAKACLRARSAGLDALGDAVAWLGAAVIPPAEARYFKYWYNDCRGSGAITFKVLACYGQGDGRYCAVELSQRGRACGYVTMQDATAT